MKDKVVLATDLNEVIYAAVDEITPHEDDSNLSNKRVIRLSNDKPDKATEHLAYIGSGRKEKDEEDRLREIFTRTPVAEMKRNEEKRSR